MDISFKQYVDFVTPGGDECWWPITHDWSIWNHTTGATVDARNWGPRPWPQIDWILDEEKNKVIVDYIGRTETLEKDIINISNNINIPQSDIDLLYTNTAKTQENSSTWRYANYKDYYDDETRKKVEKYYERDLDFLKGKF